MQANKLPAERGWAWIVEAFALVRRAPAPLATGAVVFLSVILVLSLVPYIGPVLAALVLPMLNVGYYLCSRAVDRGQSPPRGLLFSGWHHNRKALLTLGGINFALSAAVDAATYLVDGGMLWKVASGQVRIDPQTPLDPLLAKGVVAYALLSIPHYMLFWFAPVLVGLGGVTPLKALFFSLIATWRNLLPFAIFSVGYAVLLGTGMTLLMGVAAMLPSLLAAALLGMVIVAIVLPLFFCAYYLGVRDVLGDLGADSATRQSER